MSHTALKATETMNTDMLEITKHWEAGETGCGQLIAGLRHQVGQLRAGDLLRVTALDAGAPVDLPAWCRMTGHSLVSAEHPVYVLKIQDDQIHR